jgi:hypothetical protein
MRTIKIITELANGAMPVTAEIVMLSRAEVLELAAAEVLMGHAAGGEPIIIWLADDIDADTELLHTKFEQMFAHQGVPLETWNLGGED